MRTTKPQLSDFGLLYFRRDSVAESGQHGDLGTSLCIVATIVNFPQIEQAYGHTFASAMCHLVHERARALSEHCSATVAVSRERMLFVFDKSGSLGQERGGYERRGAKDLNCVLTSLSSSPITSGDTVAFPVIEASVATLDDKPFNIVDAGSSRMIYGQPGTEWRAQYIADTKTALRIFQAMADGRIDFDYEHVRDASGAQLTAYREALLCEISDRTSEHRRIGVDVHSLERIGLVRRLDQWVVESIVAKLRAAPDDKLGCNISAQSATLDAWWALTIGALADEPDVASRLTLEITETSPLDDFERAREFVRTLRELGCSVALDDLGSGYSSMRNLTELGVNIAKVGRSFVAAGRADSLDAKRLSQLVGFAKAFAPSVVIEGVETEIDARLALASGATHLQGYFYARNGTS
ncbi:EAL domain-containing protein [Trinickia violacea]|uniref:EAL domain-containing protein n=1 Tax=Trinickia violacea TaxID=2571746 RepID=A0A4P8IJD2_9BURK|nr:EAL domain-containing protein [Trinickia violacea]QCP47901.1 EAL domain-containing protein [Trinickia violacea]